MRHHREDAPPSEATGRRGPGTCAERGVVTRRRVVDPLLVALVALLLAACGGSNSTPIKRSSAAGTAANLAEPAACHTSQLRLARVGGGAATGTSYTWYGLRNAARATCSMIGYPGVAIIDARGRIVQHPAARSPHPGTLLPLPVTLVVLKPGQQAKFVVASTDVIPTRGCRTAYSGVILQVYPPNQRVPIREPYRGSFCNLVVGPVQPTG